MSLLIEYGVACVYCIIMGHHAWVLRNFIRNPTSLPVVYLSGALIGANLDG